ncbi:MAG: TRAP transporter permease, partial [Nitrososphaerales archaeon]|nr:TRAP transporter permease [Nitrososphaerales archaeon]
DIVLAILGALGGAYILIYYEELVYRVGAPTQLDVIFGAITLIMIIEATRRSVGLPLATIASVFILYTFLGPYMPGFLAHRGYSLMRVIDHLYLTMEGIFGIPLGVSSTFVFLFILLGSFLEKVGVGTFFIDLARALLGHTRGGPAKIAVFSSALFGTISGSSVANVFSTGVFTIPMMKRLGYKPYLAGAGEVTTSTGGQLMPPIMGAAAFIMSEWIGVPYISIAASAAIPAILYFLAVGIMVHIEAVKTGLKGLPREELPKLREVLKRSYLITPLIVIILLLVMGYTPLTAALGGIFSTIAVSFVKKETRLTPLNLLMVLEDGARKAVMIAVACACAGIIVGTLTLTGLGLTFAYLVVALAADFLPFALLLSMITCLILGMGVPTTANYVITATMVAPALLKIGVPMLVAHFFVFYFGIIADITPPVALAAYAGASIARADPIRTGLTATRLGIAAYLVPYVFVYSPTILLIGATVENLLWVTLTAITGVVALAGGLQGYFLRKTYIYERIPLVVAGIMLINPEPLTDMIGIGIFLIILLLQKLKR